MAGVRDPGTGNQSLWRGPSLVEVHVSPSGSPYTYARGRSGGGPDPSRRGVGVLSRVLQRACTPGDRTDARVLAAVKSLAHTSFTHHTHPTTRSLGSTTRPSPSQSAPCAGGLSGLTGTSTGSRFVERTLASWLHFAARARGGRPNRRALRCCSMTNDHIRTGTAACTADKCRSSCRRRVEQSTCILLHPLK